MDAEPFERDSKQQKERGKNLYHQSESSVIIQKVGLQDLE